jgi:SAM-dependent methyltransferase
MPYLEDEKKSYLTSRKAHWNDLHEASLGWFSKEYRTCLAGIYQNIIPSGAKVLELGCGDGRLLATLNPAYGVGIDFSEKIIESAKKNYPKLKFVCGDVYQLHKLVDANTFDYVIVSDLVNDLWDLQLFLEVLQGVCGSHTRVIFNYHSHAWSAPLAIVQKLKLARKTLKQNWLTKHDMENFLNVAGYEFLQNSEEILIPFKVPFLTKFFNCFLVKIWPFRYMALVNVMVARSITKNRLREATVSVIVPARNEFGHILELFRRIPDLGRGTEVIFVEGNSTDETYTLIEKTITANPHRNFRLIKQSGKGKGDAVRAGFEAANGDILMILDADITVPPEDLQRFYNLLIDGKAEFVNGVRLVYPMDDEAMRFLNLLGNKFFSWTFSWLLGQPIRDTLCGTKALWRSDYLRIAENRSYFGEFDPFGDFDLLFGAARLQLKILEIPIRYRARSYGETNISRWRHGWLLLRMVFFAARRIKFI